MITIKNLNKTYDRHTRRANRVLHDISLTLPDTGFVCIIGASGCGKTSLLNAIGGLDSFDNGTIEAGNTTVNRSGTRKMENERNRSFGYIFQNYYLLSDHSVGYNVYLGLHSSGLSHKDKLRRVKEALREVDMERYVNRIVGELSGGQQQRVAIARALARRPRVIFADEPTGNLDESNTVNICTLLRKISRHSLVVMVTHEERIAHFFADKIITLSDGRIKNDTEITDRADFSENGGNTVYTGDFEEEKLGDGENLSLRVLREEGATPVDLTLVVQKDKIIIKLDSELSVSCLRSEELPIIVEGDRPKLSLDEMDSEANGERFVRSENEKAVKGGRVKSSLRLPMLISEARNLIMSSKKKNVGRTFFLMALTALTMLSVSDFITVSNIDPEDFIVSDSHLLKVEIARDSELPIGASALNQMAGEFRNYLLTEFPEIEYLPTVPRDMYYTTSLFRQLESVRIDFNANSFIPSDHLKEEDLIHGRMPENPYEIVVDRWVLDALLTKDGILQNSIDDCTYFLGRKLTFVKVRYSPTIVGISDSGEPNIYLKKTAFISIGPAENEILTLSELKSMFPGQYDDITLEKDSCIAVIGNASGANAKVGGYFYTTSKKILNVTHVIENKELYASNIISQYDADLLYDYAISSSNTLNIYCPDKEAVKEFLAKELPSAFKNKIQLIVTDSYSDAYAAYLEATSVKVNARTVIIATVIALSATMLYLLSRSHVIERMGMVAVYRLLGIPGRKLISIFAIECCLLSLKSSLPASLITFAVIHILNLIPELGISMLLPAGAATLVYLAIIAFHLLVTAIPLLRLLKLPPARLATKYDF